MLDFAFGLLCLCALKVGSQENADEAPLERTVRKVRKAEGRDRNHSHRPGTLRALRDRDRRREEDTLE